MAGATHGTRFKTMANGTVKWYATLNFDGRKTERYGGYKESDAYALGVKLCGAYNQNRAGVLKDTNQPISRALERFTARPGISSDTHELNQTNLESFFETYPDITQLEGIDKDAILTYLDDLRARKLSDNYISIKLRILKTFLNFCVEKNWLAKNLFPKGIVPRYFSKGHFFPEDERQMLLAPSPSTDLRILEAHDDLTRAIQIAFHQGWREQTIWEMDWKHYRPQDNMYLVRGLKGAQDMWVEVHPVTLKMMGERKKEGRIFTRWGSPGALGLAFRRRRRAVGLTIGRFHDTKHTAVSMLEEQGFSTTEISEITNTSGAALIHYKHANKERLKKRFKNFNVESNA